MFRIRCSIRMPNFIKILPSIRKFLKDRIPLPFWVLKPSKARKSVKPWRVDFLYQRKYFSFSNFAEVILDLVYVNHVAVYVAEEITVSCAYINIWHDNIVLIVIEWKAMESMKSMKSKKSNLGLILEEFYGRSDLAV